MAENKRKYWLHRITGGANAKKLSHPLLFKHRILTTGWARLSWDEFVTKSQGDWNTFIKEFKLEYPSLGNFRSLWNFLEMKKGDIVVVPTVGKFSLYRVADNNIYTNQSLSSIISEDDLLDKYGKKAYVDIDNDGYSYLFDEDGDFIDLGFFRRVEPIVKHLRRSSCKDGLRNMMSVPRTNINLDGVQNYIDPIINQYDIDFEEPEEDEEDYYSPTSWDRDPDETDEEYQDRMQDQEDLLEYFDE
ncbi:MAG: hypothetical protein SPJ08_03880 [Sphaerochaetaceae bacterium]|nr:hypothetical protein [Sphaerochaetaceae bacterium]